MHSSVSNYAGKLYNQFFSDDILFMTNGSLLRRNLKRFMKRNKTNVILWISFAIFILFAFHFFSDGDFSFLLVFDDNQNSRSIHS